MSVELDLLKRTLAVLHDERVPKLVIASALINDIQRYLKQAAKSGDSTPCCQAPIVHYRSLNKKVCADCGKEFDWYLKEGQLPLIKATR